MAFKKGYLSEKNQQGEQVLKPVRIQQTKYGPVPIYRAKIVDTGKYQKREPGKR